MRLLLAALIAFSAAFAADTPKDQQGTWKFDVSKSDWSNNPNGSPREATLTITDNGWTYVATESSGKKTDLRFDKQANSVSGNDHITVKMEPTGNPNLSDMRICDKDTGRELERVVTAAVPGGKSLVLYGSGVTPDGKQWWDTSYFDKVR
ncbi:MAG: hypothetical protein M3Y57_21275 [Acidobacteriota bacterium]|nr:hypothetical protein [Acidobacteriota bacterium]